MGTEHRPCPLILEKSDVVLVKPSDPTPLIHLSLSTIDNDPYIETIAKTVYVYKPSDTSIHDADPASLLEQALSKALFYYYPLAGKLKRRADGDRKLLLSCTAEGVPFIRAAAACTLSSLNYLDGADVRTTYQLVPDYDAVSDATTGYHPLALQVTKFSCGGFTVGIALSHSVCDGSGAAQFYRALTELASGKSEPTVKPVWERERLVFVGQVDDDPNLKLFDFDMASVATSPHMPTDDMAREAVNVTPDGLKRLKKRIAEETSLSHEESFTTLEILAAYVWRARFRALNLNPEGITLFGVAVGIRRVIEPPLPEGYYGNAFVNASVTLTGKELDEYPLSRTARLIKRMKKAALDKQYVSDKLRDTEKRLKTEVKFVGGNGAFMFLSDWRSLGLLVEVDFGWKGSVDIVPLVAVNLPDVCIFLPASKVDPEMEGGVRVLVTLPRAAMAKFKEEMDALHKTGAVDDAASHSTSLY